MRIFIIAFLFSTLVLPAYGGAQDLTDSEGKPIYLDSMSEKESLTSINSNVENMKIDRRDEVTVVEDKYSGDHVAANLENISKLYWKKGALSVSKTSHIDNFLRINECDIYEKFYEDEFEWARIRKAARKMIEANKEHFSDKFKIIIPLDLGRYDMKRKGFPLVSNTSFLDLRRVEIGGGQNEEVCGDPYAIEGYPKSLILILSKPYNLDFIELDEHVAQAFIIQQKYEPTEVPKELRRQGFSRLVYARVRFSLDKYQGETLGEDRLPRAVVFGDIEGVDIFEDAEEKVLIKTINIKN